MNFTHHADEIGSCHIDSCPHRGNILSMHMDDDLPNRADDPLRLVTRQDLDPLSVNELQDRIKTLEAEIKRTQSKISHAVNHKASAEALFRK